MPVWAKADVEKTRPIRAITIRMPFLPGPAAPSCLRARKALVSFKRPVSWLGLALPPSRFPSGIWQAHVPYSRGGGSGISPASRFTFPVEKHRLI